MGRAKFLLCLPARLGVLLFSLGEFLSSGLLAAWLWITLARDEQDKNVQLSKRLLISICVLGGISTIIALCSFAGFIGAITKRPRAIRAFARAIAWLLGVQLITSTLYIIAIFVEPKSDFIKACENGSADARVVDACTNRVGLAKGVFVGVIVVALLLHMYELYVVSAYATELERTELNRNIILGNKYEDTRPLTGPDLSYPYADKAHRGGNYA